MDDLGVASIYKEYNGGRDFWFERRHLSARVCVFEAADENTGVGVNLTVGAIPYSPNVSGSTQAKRRGVGVDCDACCLSKSTTSIKQSKRGEMPLTTGTQKC